MLTNFFWVMSSNKYSFLVYYMSSYASAVLEVVILSVHLSHVCFVTKLNNALRIFWYHTKRAITPVFWHQSGWWATSPPSEICAQSDSALQKMPTSTDFHFHYNVSTVRDSENSSIVTNRKLTTGFPMSYRWSAYVTPMPSKGWLKNDFFCFWWQRAV